MGTPNSNGTALPKEKANGAHQPNGKGAETKPSTPASPEPAKPEPPKEPTAQELARQRIDKRNRLNALYEDIEKLTTARQSFDGINTFGDLTIAVKAGNEIKFLTTRTDAVQAALKSLENSIDTKLAEAYKQLAEFEF